ncbi:MAG: hypothetical protein IKS10_04645 [Lachnospiraceae bacterium]|nr:hypothetical protein [Lachnospiraceae bacterium]
MQSLYETGDIVYIPVRIRSFELVGLEKIAAYTVDQSDIRFEIIKECDIERRDDGMLVAKKQKCGHLEEWPFELKEVTNG